MVSQDLHRTYTITKPTTQPLRAPVRVTIWFTVLNAIGATSNMLVKLKIES